QLTDPRLTVSFTSHPPTPPATQATQPVQTVVKFGRYDDVLKRNVFAQVSGHPEVVKIPASSLESLNKTPLDLRDRTVVDVDPTQVTRVAVHRTVAATTRPATRAASSNDLVVEAIKAPPTTTKAATTTTTASTSPTGLNGDLP